MKKVLVVEDEQLIRRGLIRQMDWESCGCRVVGEAVNGENGLMMIEKLRPQIVITDIRMPVMDGLEMLRRSKDQYGYQAVVISGYSEFEYAQKALAMNVSGYLLKPIDLQDLNVLLKKLADQMPDPEMPPLSLLRSSWEPLSSPLQPRLLLSQLQHSLPL